MMVAGLVAAMAAITARPPTPQRQAIVVAAWTDCLSRQPDSKLEKRVEAETDELARTLQRVAADLTFAAPVLRNPTRRQVLDLVAAVKGPLWFVYSGHAHHLAGRSAICLAGKDDLLIDDIVDHLPAGNGASFWFNACYTAEVDVRRFGTSVIAASPEETDSGLTNTPLGAALTVTVRDPPGQAAPTDANCDGLITDRELFQSTRVLLPAHGERPPRPKFRRQGWTELPLYTLRERRPDCPPPLSLDDIGKRFPQLGPLLAQERRYRAGSGDAEQWPPIVWVWTGAEQPPFSPRAPRFLVSAGKDDVAVLARSVLVAQVWEISWNGRELTVRDGRDPDLPPLWRGPTAAARFDSEREVAILTTFYGPPPKPEATMRRYRRPVLPEDRRGLDGSGFAACSCTDWFGQCFCKSGGAQAK